MLRLARRLARTVFVLALSLVVLGIFWQAIYGSSAYQECSSKNGNKSSAEYQGQEKDLPTAFIALLDNAHIDFRCAERSIAENNAVISAVATVVIAVFTTILGLFTMSLARSTRIAADAARDGAKAADLSARATIALQLPIIRVKPHSLGHGDSRDGEIVTEHCSIHYLTFFNLGLTKAFPVEVRCGWTIGEELPVEPIFLVTETFLPNIIFEPDPKAESRKFLEFEIPLRPGEWSLIRGGKLGLWFYCNFGYDDFMGDRHDAVFCWRWQNGGLGMDWGVDDTPAYNRKT
jgi:hypothetical protein